MESLKILKPYMERIIQELKNLSNCLDPEFRIPDIEIDNDPVILLDDFSVPLVQNSKSNASSSSNNSTPALQWLKSGCRVIAAEQELDEEQILVMIYTILENNSLGSDEIQMALVDLVGFNHLDFVASLISQRTELLHEKNFPDSTSFEEVGPGLSKEATEEWRKKNRLKAIERNAQLTMSNMLDPHFPHVYRQQQESTAAMLTNIKRVLPAGTTRESFPTYEYVNIPAQVTNTKFHPKYLLPVADLDDLCKVTFSQYNTLNKIQTLVFPECYESRENLLICAPTGAGKTDVALLSILSTIKTIRDSDEPWKIVYVAPLKALAAEITEKLGSRLAWLGVKVRELTGDMQLTRSEISTTHVLVTTPEKWDVVTRKQNDDSGVATQLQLLIIDEVHLLHEERGAVLESIVARTRRQVEAQQRLIRIVGLSATLPNFVDVSEFLGVNPQKGLFFFDNSFRPVPLEQEFFGVKAPKNNPRALNKALDQVAYDECVKQLKKGHSVMVFVHSRRDTTKTAENFKRLAQQDGLSDLFQGENADKFKQEMGQYSHKDTYELFRGGFAIHHAGMSRFSRNWSERLFSNGGVRVLCTTSTLAWGVNLPAAVVIIKGTQVYDAQRGGFVDLGISDVIQIFGRAGRPQFEQTGTGILCTSSDKLDHYLDAITNQHPIESRFIRKIPENLNAEIALGTVANVNEAVQWLGYTYMFVRMRKAPQVYGILPRDIANDSSLVLQRRKLVIEAARMLRDTQMIVFHEDDETESLIAKDIGRIASEFYILRSTVEQFNEMMKDDSNEQQIIFLLSKGEDFSSLKVRSEEIAEMEKVSSVIPFKTDLSDSSGKASALLQAWISRVNVTEAALNSDMAYVAQNSARILRAFFLLCISRSWAEASFAALQLEKSLAKRCWLGASHPLLQIQDMPAQIQRKLVASNKYVEDLKPFSARELGDLVHNQGWGPRLSQMLQRFPSPSILLAQAKPLTSRVVRVKVEAILLPPFRFDLKIHGNALLFWLFVHASSQLLHVQKFSFALHTSADPQKFEFFVPYTVDERQVIVQVVSDTFLGAETAARIDFGRLKLPKTQSIRTNLLRLRPLSMKAWHNPVLEKHYSARFKHFNPMQTMAFHSLYHKTTEPILIGSPTGSGKTIACEVAIWAALRDRPEAKIVYIAPMKALVKERVKDWKCGLCQVPFLPGNKKPSLVELTGDTQPTGSEVRKASFIITTPEKFDGISRHQDWALKDVALVIMDEIHLLASDRGAILEVIVSRLNRSKSSVRLLGLSTAVANAGDLASWLGIKTNFGLFNFPSSVRPVPLEMYIYGFPEVQGGFCPLMKSMNKPAYLAIRRHSPNKPALIFVPSRRQTRLTALDLISLSAGDDQTGVNTWLHMSDLELKTELAKVKDETLKHSLQFGITIHHAGLEYSDRQISHDLFSRGKVQILVATSTLAWGVNLPAYLVIVKGTQFFDAKTNKYKDMDLTDVLQMMGRAGRPSFDSSGVATVFTKQSTKQFYKYFLNLGFPVESSLHKPNVLENHMGAEISEGRVTSMQEALEFLAHTFLFRRVHSNASYYIENESDGNASSTTGTESPVEKGDEDYEIKANRWLVDRIHTVISELVKSQCLTSSSNDLRLRPTTYLSISSFYYISHLTMRMFLNRIADTSSPKGVLQCLALATEYDELAIRHNEDLLNSALSKDVEFPAEDLGIRMFDPHVKAYLLVQSRMRRLAMPVEDYIQDTITVLDQAIRIIQALIDTAAHLSLISSVVTAIKVLRSIKQGVESTDDNMLQILPGMKKTKIDGLSLKNIRAEDSASLRVPKKDQPRFARIVQSLPRVDILEVNRVARIEPRSHAVYCPAFHKAQRESWFVILTENGKITSLERVQRAKTVQALPSQKLIIMNDTVAIDYELKAI